MQQGTTATDFLENQEYKVINTKKHHRHSLTEEPRTSFIIET